MLSTIIALALTLFSSPVGAPANLSVETTPTAITAPLPEMGGWKVDVDNEYKQIMPKAAKDANVDITNDGPGSVFVLVWDSELEFEEYVLEAGESMVIGVEKGGGFGIGLQNGSDATGTYTVS